MHPDDTLTFRAAPAFCAALLALAPHGAGAAQRPLDDASRIERERAERVLAGEIDAVRTVDVLGRAHVVLEVGVEALLDLGPAEALIETPARGAWIVARGDESAAFRRRVMLADAYRIERGIERTVERASSALEGRVGEITTADVGGRAHVLVQLLPPAPPTAEPDPRRPWIVDAGPADALDAALQPGDPLIAVGAPTGYGDGRLILASELTHAGRTIEIRRRSGPPPLSRP